MSTRKQHYDIHLNIAGTDPCIAAECVLIEEHDALTLVGFRYHPDYLERPTAIALDPAQLPLGHDEYELTCRGGAPGFLDDYLPDNWGRKILTQLALYRDHRHLNANSVIDTLSMIGGSHIGALSITPRDETPVFELGASTDQLSKAERAAQEVDHPDFGDASADEVSLLYLANAGSGVGGARPKALMYDEHSAYIAKFNRHQDPYNNARVELACLHLADCADLLTADLAHSRVVPGINEREVLLLERFDINRDGTRNHLISINALLKEAESQRDIGQAFRYDHVAAVIGEHSTDPQEDLQQLLNLMVFNRAINNTDDHERNFSLINRGDGYRFSPSYDMVPSTTQGAYHAAGFDLSHSPPSAVDVMGLGKVFGLSKPTVRQCAESVLDILPEWQAIADQYGVDEQLSTFLADRFNAYLA